MNLSSQASDGRSMNPQRQRAPRPQRAAVPSGRSRRWRRRDLIVALMVVAYVAVQIVVPSAALLERGGFLLVGPDLTHWDSGQVRYGWQMFSVISAPAEYEVQWPDRSATIVNSVRELGRIRGRAHYADVPERLCERFPTAVAVRRDDMVHAC